MKLVIYDPSWPIYEPVLRSRLGGDWIIRCGANDLAWLQAELPDSDAMLGITLPPEALPFAKRLKLFLFPGAGVPEADSSSLPEGCVLSNVFEHEIPVAEYVLMTILMHVTGIVHTAQRFRLGDWDGNGRVGGKPHREAYGHKLGLLGYGHIGQTVAKRALAFGMEVQAVRKNPKQPVEEDVTILTGSSALDRLLETSDFLVIACPLKEDTRGLIGEQQLRRMKKDAVLINVARAEIVDEATLYRALSEKWFAAAVLDTWYQYPAHSGERIWGSRFPFHQLENVLMTPHFSAWTQPMIERRADRMADNLKRLAQGRPLERIVMMGSWRENAGPNPLPSPVPI